MVGREKDTLNAGPTDGRLAPAVQWGDMNWEKEYRARPIRSSEKWVNRPFEFTKKAKKWIP